MERFNGSFRRELLNGYLFATLQQVREHCRLWQYNYNHLRPHQALHFTLCPPPNSVKLPDLYFSLDHLTGKPTQDDYHPPAPRSSAPTADYGKYVYRQRGSPQAALIRELNPVIRGWCSIYYAGVVAKYVSSRLD